LSLGSLMDALSLFIVLENLYRKLCQSKFCRHGNIAGVNLPLRPNVSPLNCSHIFFKIQILSAD
jgi:hypothetical protein